MSGPTATTTPPPPTAPGPAREMTAVELLRWSWRQLTSMRTALVLLFLLALAAIPGSVIPQENVDAFAVSRWQEQHPTLTPVYEALGLFSVFDSVWFSAIYLMLMVSLVGCILPRTKVYWRGMRAAPPAAPRNLTRLPDSTTYTTDEDPDAVLERARAVLRGRRFRVAGAGDALSSERGYLREAGNLLFHVSVLVVLVGFGIGALFGYQGGVIVVTGNGFSNNLTQYDDFVPGSLMEAEDMEPFSFDVNDFDINWLMEGPRAGMAQKFVADLDYREEPGAETKRYDLRVNHPLSIGGTDVFLIGHGYAPEITVRDGNGDVAYTGPVIFLPEDQATFRSFGVVKAPDARPRQIGLEGLLYPTFALVDGDPASVFGDDRNPRLSMLAYAGDLGMDGGVPQSVYVLDKDGTEQLTEEDGSMFRVDLFLGETVELPDGAGSVTFEGIEPWVRVQISKTPGKEVALAGVILALVGLLGSLFIRPRRIWVRARRSEDGTVVEVAVLDRSSGGDVGEELAGVVAALQGEEPDGPDGLARPDGPDGSDGPDGPNGPDGSQEPDEPEEKV
ncbi:cytochrome c biogenesis protein ResB [Nocardioides donggukensis]|uniref:Cytochrome c biogenesis protein ResB n=1 Tax=Nocardioides donggukensis TaxID=2774019 RepID=A0A927KAV0_9ACTN|nr:cytochrome c biogenesis protein ResB [Nocardioides donggukensis]MBD8870820.1 cytochrome c biogenesis protein ResB [Nocardioides donggukensis]